MLYFTEGTFAYLYSQLHCRDCYQHEHISFNQSCRSHSLYRHSTGHWVSEALYMVSNVMLTVSSSNNTELGTWNDLEG